MLKKITFAAGLALLLLALLLPAALAEDAPAHDHYATCQTPGVCAVCGLEDAALEGQHVYDQKQYYTNNSIHKLVCDLCGAKSDTYEFHTTTGPYSSNATEHWRVCLVCEAVCGRGEHYTYCFSPGACYGCGRVDAMITADHMMGYYSYLDGHQYGCSHCDEVDGEKEPHINPYYTFDDALAHYVVCSICSDSNGSTGAQHRYDDANPGVCIDCGFGSSSGDGDPTVPHTHTYTRNEYGSDGTNHWLICDTCDEPSTEVTPHSGSIDYNYNDTEHWYRCFICNQKYGAGAHTYEQKKYEYMDWFHTPLCDVCGRGDYDAIASHTSTTNWESDGTNHWHVCDTCGEKYNIGTHKAYCTVPGICYTCSRADDSLEGTHDVYCKAFETYHQDICTFCKEPQSEAEPHVNPYYVSTGLYSHNLHCDVCETQYFMHRYDMNNPTACLDCGIPNSGLEERCEHQYGVKYGSDETNHWDLCHICCLPNSASLTAHTWVIKKTTATCTQAGETTYTCLCKNTKTETAALGHDWKETERIAPTCTDAGSVTKVCQRCNTSETEEISAKNHDWKEAENIAPTCVSKGYIMTVCMNCSKTAVEEIPSLGHEAYEAENTAPTCTEKGRIVTACRNCEETTIQEIPTLGHEWYEAKKVEPTCTEKGHIITACRNCEETTTQEISALSHEWYEAERVEATATEKGYIITACKNCDEKTTQELPVLSHTHELYEASRAEATCTAKGYIITACKSCSEITTQEIPALSHEWYEAERVEATTTEKGYIITACKNCDETTTQELPVLGHTHEFYEAEKVEPTCKDKGYIITACKGCDETTTQEIPALSHDWYEAEKVEATCKENGYTVSACRNCDETLRVEGEKVPGHRWGKVEIVPATCTEKGSETKTCTLCGTFTRKLTDPLGHEFSETGDSICARCGYEEAWEENPVASEQPQGMEAVIAAFRAENPKAQVMHVALGQDELPMQLAGSVRFTVPLNAEAGEAFRLVQVLESGEIVEIAYEIIDGNMVFEADILGYFALLPV